MTLEYLRETCGCPKARWPEDPAWRQHIAKSWDPVPGDRRQEIVLIAADLDKAAIRRQLGACLVGEANAKELPVSAWRLPDSFPAWKRANPS
jgi:hypothetical protein